MKSDDTLYTVLKYPHFLVVWTKFDTFQLYCESQFYWWRKIIERPQVTDKLDYIVLYRLHHAKYRIQTYNFSGGRHRLHR